MPTKKVNCTKDYRLFRNNAENRIVDVAKHKKLRTSMKEYGFIPSFPIVVKREGSALIVLDGQHRLAVAEELGLPVWWTDEKIEFDIATINGTSVVWKTRDYAEKFATNGKAEYQKGLKFADEYGLSVGTAFALLGGTTSFGNVEPMFKSGEFKAKDLEWARSVASTYKALIGLGCDKNSRLLEACMCVCRVENFDPARLISGAKQCRDRLLSYTNRDAYLLMLEEVYNFHRKYLVGLRTLATEAMRSRNIKQKNGNS